MSAEAAEWGQSGRREKSETQPSLSEAVTDKQVGALASAARSPLQTSHINQENTHSQADMQLWDMGSKFI